MRLYINKFVFHFLLSYSANDSQPNETAVTPLLRQVDDLALSESAGAHDSDMQQGNGDSDQSDDKLCQMREESPAQDESSVAVTPYWKTGSFAPPQSARVQDRGSMSDLERECHHVNACLIRDKLLNKVLAEAWAENDDERRAYARPRCRSRSVTSGRRWSTIQRAFAQKIEEAAHPCLPPVQDSVMKMRDMVRLARSPGMTQKTYRRKHDGLSWAQVREFAKKSQRKELRGELREKRRARALQTKWTTQNTQSTQTSPHALFQLPLNLQEVYDCFKEFEEPDENAVKVFYTK